jgi:hypothetical protein
VAALPALAKLGERLLINAAALRLDEPIEVERIVAGHC